MRTTTFTLLLLLALTGLGCAADFGADLEPGALSLPGKADGASDVVFTTAEHVQRLAYRDGEERSDEEAAFVFGELITPDSSLGGPWRYLRPMSALGYYGPLGPYGPLGLLGPTGGNPWNADLYVTGSFAWSDHSEELTANGGPLSADGPLGRAGPLNPARWNDVGSLEDGFVPHLRPGGVFAPLGPVGVSGALGPLGPLGPVGAHGYERRDGGEYWPEDDAGCHDAPEGFEAPPCRRVEVEWEAGGERRTYELVELYDEAYAAQMEDNDTSFMVIGESEVGEQDEYAFASESAQWVTVVLLPETARYPFAQAMSVLGASASEGYRAPSSAFVPHMVTGFPVLNSYDHATAFDDFDLEVDVVVGGRVLGTIVSQSADVVDWVHVKVPAGAQLRARVRLYSEWTARFSDAAWGLAFRPADPSYRMIVVGSTEAGQGPNTFSGPYLRAFQ